MVLSKREQRLQFLGLDDRDVTLLRALRPVFEQHAGAAVDEFCRQLEHFPETAGLLQRHTTGARLRELLLAHLLRIPDADFDDNYFADRQRLGHTHERISLPPRWFILAHHHLFRLLVPLIRDHYADQHQQADNTILALQKILTLDASLAMDAYIASDRYRRAQAAESVINDSGDAIFTMDADKFIRSWNPAAARIFGWTAGEIVGQPVQRLIPLDLLAARELEQIDEAVAIHNHLQIVTVRLAKDGRRVPVELTVSVLRDPNGAPIGRCAVLRDITERKQLEEKKLQSERLAVIGAMSAKLAHEIRNPLASITLNLSLVDDEAATLAAAAPAATAEMRTLLSAIGAEVRRIERVTEDYLQFAKMPKPRRDLVILNDLLTQGLSFLQTSFDAAKVTLRRDLDPRLPAVFGDEAQLWQAILNLIRNAIEAMPQGGALTLTTMSTGAGVVVRVADTGKGIDPATRDNLFKPFYSTKASGTGLGLPLTQQIITEHGGRIHCESAPDRGTTFTIELPVP